MKKRKDTKDKKEEKRLKMDGKFQQNEEKIIEKGLKKRRK